MPSIHRTHSASASSTSRRNELVIIVHGLWMHGIACALLARRLRRRGYRVGMFSYRSTRWALSEIAARLHAYARAQHPVRVHFVGHSLGGLAVLSMLHDCADLPLGRVVLLGSPCNDCEAARQLAARRGGPALLGRALHDWRREAGEAVAHRVPVAMIAGTRRFGLGSVLVRLTAPNDGVVTLEETRLAGLADHLVLPVTHSGMILSGLVADQVAQFLAAGRFTHSEESPA
ncbi:MAG: hypothetical protein KIS79_09330 [Burkholderiales bacterium]|nr:hypothetical protein [Burkholderiales bacterium]